MTLRPFPALFALAFVACAPPTQILKKSYQPPQLDGASLLLYPIPANAVNVLNREDFSDDFEDVNGDPGEFLSGELSQAAGKYFPENFRKVKVEQVDDSGFEPLNEGNSLKVSEVLGKDAFEARVPTQEYLRAKNLDPRFVLVMDQVVFSRNLESVQYSSPNPAAGGMPGKPAAPMPVTMTGSKKSIAMGVNYVIYDYGDGSVVGYGFAKGEKTFKFAMTRSDWYAAMDDALRKIKQFSPF